MSLPVDRHAKAGQPGADPAGGREYVLEAHGYRAHVMADGATLRAASFHGRDLIVPFADDEPPPAMRGALLAPWPNRTASGRYSFAGRSHQLAVSGADGHASHGLVAMTRFAAVTTSDAAVVLRATIGGAPGYPWRIELTVSFAATADGIVQTLVARNLSDQDAPFGCGFHPYVLAAERRARGVDTWSVELHSERVLLVDDATQLPVRSASIHETAGRDFDFRVPRRLGNVVLNHAFGQLARDAQGWATVTVRAPGGRGVAVDIGPALRWVQLYTTDWAHEGIARDGVAVEPMSCPPDAFNSKTDLITLEPGEARDFAWRLRAVGR